MIILIPSLLASVLFLQLRESIDSLIWTCWLWHCFCFSHPLYPWCLLGKVVQNLSAINPFILSVIQPLL